MEGKMRGGCSSNAIPVVRRDSKRDGDN